ncbi:MAG: hypothetical protein ACLGSA_15400 [Acidobacteriota bacterium]
MHRRAREILSSNAFLASLAVCGLLLLSWPLVSVLASIGSFGQLLSLFIIWLALVLGGFAWSAVQGGRGERPRDGSGNLACTWPAKKGASR